MANSFGRMEIGSGAEPRSISEAAVTTPAYVDAPAKAGGAGRGSRGESGEGGLGIPGRRVASAYGPGKGWDLGGWLARDSRRADPQFGFAGVLFPGP